MLAREVVKGKPCGSTNSGYRCGNPPGSKSVKNQRKLDQNNLHAIVCQCAPPSDLFCSYFFSSSCLSQNLM